MLETLRWEGTLHIGSKRGSRVLFFGFPPAPCHIANRRASLPRGVPLAPLARARPQPKGGGTAFETKQSPCFVCFVCCILRDGRTRWQWRRQGLNQVEHLGAAAGCVLSASSPGLVSGLLLAFSEDTVPRPALEALHYFAQATLSLRSLSGWATAGTGTPGTASSEKLGTGAALPLPGSKGGGVPGGALDPGDRGGHGHKSRPFFVPYTSGGVLELKQKRRTGRVLLVVRFGVEGFGLRAWGLGFRV